MIIKCIILLALSLMVVMLIGFKLGGIEWVRRSRKKVVWWSIGALAVIVVGNLVYGYFKRDTVQIPLGSFTSACWDEYGPGHDGPKWDSSHIWMARKGYITFPFYLHGASSGRTYKLEACLSAESDPRARIRRNGKSRVEIQVNGNSVGTIEVAEDNLIGEIKTDTSVNSEYLHKGKNFLTFIVEGENANGLCIYSRHPLCIRIKEVP